MLLCPHESVYLVASFYSVKTKPLKPFQIPIYLWNRAPKQIQFFQPLNSIPDPSSNLLPYLKLVFTQHWLSLHSEGVKVCTFIKMKRTDDVWLMCKRQWRFFRTFLFFPPIFTNFHMFWNFFLGMPKQTSSKWPIDIQLWKYKNIKDLPPNKHVVSYLPSPFSKKSLK